MSTTVPNPIPAANNTGSVGKAGAVWGDGFFTNLHGDVLQTIDGAYVMDVAQIARLFPGETYYVDGLTGDDDNTGTYAAPLKTLAAAVAQADVGIIVAVGPWVYRLAEPLEPSRPIAIVNGAPFSLNSARQPSVDLRGSVQPTTWLAVTDKPYYRAPFGGVAFNVWLVPRDEITVRSAVRVGSNLNVTLDELNGFRVGEDVTLFGMGDADMDGKFTITAVTADGLGITVPATVAMSTTPVTGGTASAWELRSGRWTSLQHVPDVATLEKNPGSWCLVDPLDAGATNYIYIHLPDGSNPNGQHVEVGTGVTAISPQPGCSAIYCRGIGFSGFMGGGIRMYQGDLGTNLETFGFSGAVFENSAFRFNHINWQDFNPPRWTAGEAVTVGMYRRTKVESHCILECTTAGTCGGSEPTTPASPGETVNDGGAVWTARIAMADSWQALTAYAVGDVVIPEAVANIAEWAAETAYTAGQYVYPTTPNGCMYECLVSGTSGSTPPAWSVQYYAPVPDGTAYWKRMPLYYQECRAAGTSGATQPAFKQSSTAGEDQVTEGTITWSARGNAGPNGHGITVWGAMRVVCNNCRAVGNGVDGFNAHVGALMYLNGCQADYNLDNGASPHDGAHMSINGGEFHHNGDQQLGAATGARMDVYRAVIHSGEDDGILYTGALTTGEVEGCLIGGCNRGINITDGAQATLVNNVYEQSSAIASITWDANVATVTTARPHGLIVGDTLRIGGCTKTEYNVSAVVVSADSLTLTFALVLGGDPGDATDGTLYSFENTLDEFAQAATGARIFRLT